MNMGRKVFVSVLGTGFYTTCRYASDGFCSTATRFVQLATLERLQSVAPWTGVDRLFFLLTGKARKDNWETSASGRRRCPWNGLEEEYVGLKDELEKMNLAAGICDVDIPEGKNEAEMWEIFNKLFSQIEEGDELYVDITHSFRYLPMMLLVFCNYAKFLKGTHTCSISYGNWENRDRETETAPFVDLLSLSALQDWTYAAANYLDNGNPQQLVALGKDTLKPILQAAQGSNPDASALGRFIKYLPMVIDEMRTCRGISLVKATNIGRMKKEADNMEQPFITPFVPVFEKIKSNFSGFDVQANPQNGFRAAEWCLQNGLYQQALTLMYENMVTLICMEEGLDWEHEEGRNLVGNAFKFYQENIPEEKWVLAKYPANPCPADKAARVKALMENADLHALAGLFANIRNTRNDVNHSGMRNNPMSVERLKNNIKGYFKELEVVCTRMPEVRKEEKPKLFVNLSNHPIAKWSQKQLNAAAGYGRIEEIPFPNIDSTADSTILEAIANDYVEEILERNKQYDVTVHVMGEMVFTCQVVSSLKSQGVRCVASASERCVTERADGVKENIFHFTRFRDY